MIEMYDSEIKIMYMFDGEFEDILDDTFADTEKGIKRAKIKAAQVFEGVKSEHEEENRDEDKDEPFNIDYKVIRVRTFYEFV